MGLFQLEAVVEGPAYCLAQDPVDVVDGTKGDGLEPGGVELCGVGGKEAQGRLWGRPRVLSCRVCVVGRGPQAGGSRPGAQVRNQYVG